MPKIFTYTLFVIISAQIIFSFFYSSEIINQNNKLYENQQEHQKLKIENQNLEKKFADLASIYNLNQQSQNKALIFVNQRINLK